MTATGHWRGYLICYTDGCWRYSDNLVAVKASPDRECGTCRMPNRKDGHDVCLGQLPFATNACCGHGRWREAYIQFGGRSVRGVTARILQMVLR